MSKGVIASLLICLCIVALAVVLKPAFGHTEVQLPSVINPISKRSLSEPDVKSSINVPIEPDVKSSTNVPTPDSIVMNVKRIIVADNSFTKQDLQNDEFKELFSQYKTNSQLKLPNTLKNWKKTYYVFQELCDFGYQLLQLYEQVNHKNEGYEAIAVALIKQISDVLKDYKSDDTKAFEFSGVWIYTMTYLAKFLIAYEYIGQNETIKRSICHPLIIKMVPTIKKGAGVEVSTSDVLSLHFGMIRLLTNYLYDKTSYNNDLNQINELKSISSLNISINNSDKIEQGVYRDGSCIKRPNVASYNYFVSLYSYPNYIFYENTCKVIGPKIGNLPEIIEGIFSKMFHPQINYVPFGLFDDNGSIRKLDWWNGLGVIGVFIFPLIGLGVFKNHEMMFSVRVQRPNIAACMIDTKGVGYFILGSIQLRRIYQINRTYPTELDWSQLSREPGIISLVNAENPISIDSSSIKDKTYCCTNVDNNNLVGRLPNNENVMFWFNKYECDLIQCTVTEIGVITDNGLETYIVIHNYGPADVQLRVDDEPPSDFDRKLICTSNGQKENGFIVIAPSQTQRILWAMIFDNKISSNLTYNGKTKTFIFNYASKLYSVILKENSQYIVEVGKNESVFGGSSSSDPDDSMTLNESKLIKRNPETLMYT